MLPTMAIRLCLILYIYVVILTVLAQTVPFCLHIMTVPPTLTPPLTRKILQFILIKIRRLDIPLPIYSIPTPNRRRPSPSTSRSITLLPTSNTGIFVTPSPPLPLPPHEPSPHSGCQGHHYKC